MCFDISLLKYAGCVFFMFSDCISRALEELCLLSVSLLFSLVSLNVIELGENFNTEAKKLLQENH